jgi:hypothetical protein
LQISAEETRGANQWAACQDLALQCTQDRYWSAADRCRQFSDNFANYVFVRRRTTSRGWLSRRKIPSVLSVFHLLRYRRHDHVTSFCAFDLIEDGWDLRRQPLERRKKSTDYDSSDTRSISVTLLRTGAP